MSPKLLIIFVKHCKNLVIKFSVEGPISLVFVNSSQIFSEGLLVITLTKFKAVVTLNLDHGYMIYDETYNASMHQRSGIREN